MLFYYFHLYFCYGPNTLVFMEQKDIRKVTEVSYSNDVALFNGTAVFKTVDLKKT